MIMNSSIISNISLVERLKNAKQFLIKNFTKNKIVTDRIFDVNVKTLTLFMSRSLINGRGNHNKTLKNHQMKIIHQFIKSLLIHEIQFIHEIVFSAILSLKRTQNPNHRDFTKR